MGTGYKGNTPYHHSISENLPILKEEYPYINGYFGYQGKGDNPHVRNIRTSNPQITARVFYDTLTYGGLERPLFSKSTGNVIGQLTYLADGSVISWRNVSSSDGSPAVDINIQRSTNSGGIKQQKIHFVKE